MAEDTRTKLDELLDTTGMPDGLVDFIDDLDKWWQDKGFFTPKQAAAVDRNWQKYVRDA